MEKKSTVRVAAVQIAPDLTSREKTLARVLDAIREATAKGAELIVFPETFVPWYPYFSFVLPPVLSGREHIRLYEEAVTIPSAATESVAALRRVKTASSWRWASTSGTMARSTIPSFCSTPTER